MIDGELVPGYRPSVEDAMDASFDRLADLSSGVG
jgi:hypothetical protein